MYRKVKGELLDEVTYLPPLMKTERKNERTGRRNCDISGEGERSNLGENGKILTVTPQIQVQVRGLRNWEYLNLNNLASIPESRQLTFHQQRGEHKPYVHPTYDWSTFIKLKTCSASLFRFSSGRRLAEAGITYTPSRRLDGENWKIEIMIYTSEHQEKYAKISSALCPWLWNAWL